MGPKTQNWKRTFEELTIIKENLERQLKFFAEQLKSTSNVQSGISEVKKRVAEQKKNARLDPDNPENQRLARTPHQREQRGQARRV